MTYIHKNPKTHQAVPYKNISKQFPKRKFFQNASMQDFQ